MKNIVVCCDGTSAKYGDEDENTNVVRLFERLGKDGKKQISFYDPGVGTYSPLRTFLTRWVHRLTMAVSGAGIRDNIWEAYKYLMDYYEPGDKIYLFGYSRGAYTVQKLADILRKCGLLTKGSNNLLPYARRIYEGSCDRRAYMFKSAFSREYKPHFIGVWDTVASVGWVRRQYFRDRRLNSDVAYGYQALSVDERRTHFRVALWDESDICDGQTIEQVWFPGFHGDVGGQDKKDRRISDITLKWMLRHARRRGLILSKDWGANLHPHSSGFIKPSNRGVWRLFPKKNVGLPKVPRFTGAYFSAGTKLKTATALTIYLNRIAL